MTIACGRVISTSTISKVSNDSLVRQSESESERGQINRNPNRNWTNQSESQSEPGQSMPHTVTTRSVHKVKEHKVGDVMHVGPGKIYITRSNARAP